MAISVYCARCARTISSAEMEDGLVVETERGFFCAECAQYVKSSSPAPAQVEAPARPTQREQAGEVGAEPIPQAYLPAGGGLAEVPHGMRGTKAGSGSKPMVAPGSTVGREESSDEAASENNEEAVPDDPVQLLKEIRNELKPITQAVLYERASVWNLLGAIGQIFALALLLVAVIEWSVASSTVLLAAILVQLMTLTCFLRGK